MFKHYMYKDIEVANSAYENIQPHIKKTEDLTTNVFTDNSNYNEQTSKDWYLDGIVRPERNRLIVQTNELKNQNDYPLTAPQLAELDTYRQELRDLPATIVANDFTDLSFPTKPTWLDDELANLPTS